MEEYLIDEKQEDRSWCVYIHINTINGKKYVGQTCMPIDKRWGLNGEGYMHKNKNGEYSQPAFANAIIKYGWQNFEHKIISNNLSKEEADNLEKQLIESYQSNDPKFGYNIREGGSHGRMSEKSKEKLSNSLTGKFKGEKNPMYGKKGELSPGWGRKDTDEQRKVKSERMIGEKNPMYGRTKEFMSEEERYSKGSSMRGKHHSRDVKEKISEKLKEYYKEHEHHAKGTHRSEEFKNTMREKMTGRTATDEAKKKMSENHHDVSGGNNPRARKVRCIETGEIFPSAADAGRAYNLAQSNPGSDIRSSCKNKNKTAGKDKNTNEPLHWEWIN